MLTVFAETTFETRALLNIENRILGGVRTSMQHVVDVVVSKIKPRFDDQALANTVEGKVIGADIQGQKDFYEIVGTIYSTWPNMVWYERGRPPGGKMPPKERIKGWAVRKGIQPDPERTKLAFAFAINAARVKRDKKKIPFDVLVEWIDKKGIVPSEEFALDSLAYAIGLKIVRDGITGHHYFQQGLEESRAEIHTTFEQAVISTTGI